MIDISCTSRPDVYCAENVEQDQPAHACNLILLYTIPILSFKFFQGETVQGQLINHNFLVKSLKKKSDSTG